MRGAPHRVGKVHLTDQPPNFRRYARPAGTSTRFPPPEGAKASSVPADDGLRLNDRNCIQNARCNPIQADGEALLSDRTSSCIEPLWQLEGPRRFRSNQR
jgi:hypothetical protein